MYIINIRYCNLLRTVDSGIFLHQSKNSFVLIISLGHAVGWGTTLQAWRSPDSIPGGVIGIFHWHNPPARTMALGSTQPLNETSTRNISLEVKAAGA